MRVGAASQHRASQLVRRDRSARGEQHRADRSEHVEGRDHAIDAPGILPGPLLPDVRVDERVLQHEQRREGREAEHAGDAARAGVAQPADQTTPADAHQERL